MVLICVNQVQPLSKYLVDQKFRIKPVQSYLLDSIKDRDTLSIPKLLLRNARLCGDCV